MKKLLFLLLIIPATLKAQNERLSRAYIAAIFHDFDNPGISLINSFGINQYLGIGAGADLTKYKGEVLVPIYADVRLKYPINSFAPFVFGQAGYPLFNGTTNLAEGTPGIDLKSKMKGRYFFGSGVGLSYKTEKVGIFLSYTQRAYSFDYDEVDINGRTIKPDDPKSVGILTLGLIF